MKSSIRAGEEEFSFLARQMRRWVHHVLSPGYHQYSSQELWAPSVNVYEDNAGFHVVVELAGVQGEDIDVHVEDNLLVIRGQRATPRLEKVAGVMQTHLMEIDHGSFSRKLELPASVDVSKIPAACYRNGLLWIELPKKPAP